jgi:MYXO-CTERM domain-containing protein
LTGRNSLVEIEGEDYDGQSGVTKEDSNDDTLGQSISATSGSYVYFENVDYTDDWVASVQLRVKSQSDTTLELHADAQDGTLLGECTVSSTSNAWATQTCVLGQPVTGVSRLYVVFGGAVHLNWLKFQAQAAIDGGAGGAVDGAAASGYVSSDGGGTIASGGVTGSVTGGSGGGTRSGVGGSASGGAVASGAGGNVGASGGAVSGVDSGSGGSSSPGGSSSGCSCGIGGARGSSRTMLIVGLLAAAFGLRRQRPRFRGGRRE